MLSCVVAISNNNAIGKDNKLPWYLPEDLHRFKEITLSNTKTIIMGRKTFESLPKILPDRHHIVLTKNKNYKIEDKRVTVITDIEQLNSLIQDNKEYFVIGGEEIFALLLPYTAKIYLTKVEDDFQGDAFFPNYDESQWKVIEVSEGIVDEYNKYKHKFITLERI